MTFRRHIQLGVGPHSMFEYDVDLGDGRIGTHFELTRSSPTGRGATPREAARDLAERLREVARLIEGSFP